jgi:hypothetical protein
MAGIVAKTAKCPIWLQFALQKTAEIVAKTAERPIWLQFHP